MDHASFNSTVECILEDTETEIKTTSELLRTISFFRESN